ncbi:cytochrome b N-terminal domain-containing protein [Dasania sp. GY-MA-18]|uniref:Cytochrome b n=1 Tax=Dasania phycosphaerae TaxID=2950436 RepID=A0A9J6RQ36_9GAMM|nr:MULTISPECIES: cytochrome b N-terminal domain-containing protein [Dasania]MCR8923707.1 cytochrome b N-terminal domain-containing protein [Dasania sp. GY-MA-18]MCZ0866141.1 cytochrome b N-terminal domain-containing protein [Dasania phycosphaerae]MCZ0869865.1 cytochrome b N-terminal domain-containing protein [Dasania phycosphaerae]
MINLLVGLRDWVDARLPIMRAWDTHMGSYYAPKNFNFWYYFGVLSLLVLVNQLLTGIWLTMSYTPSAENAFNSVEYIMRDVDFGWIIRYMHSTGASAFFVVVYLHMFRALIYGSYKKPRELVWVFGMFIFLVLMAEAFVGYVLPWGQMSYWGAQVIISLFGAIPVVGEDIVQWIRGDFLISGITLNRFFALHVVALPIVLLGLVVLHLLALHEVGSNNPDGVEIKKNKDENGIPKDGIPFHPYYTVHDLPAIAVFCFAFAVVIFFAPEMGGYFLEHANFEIANGLKTPEHIAPVWYFTPFYSVLRAVPDKLLGFIAFGASVAILFILPWVDRSPVKSVRYRGLVNKLMLVTFVATFLILGVLGVKAPNDGRTLLAQVTTVFYFAFFITMPIWTNKDAWPAIIRTAAFWAIGAIMLFLTFAGYAAGKPESHIYAVRFYAALNAAFFFILPALLARDKMLPVPERVTMNGGMGAWGTIGGIIVVALLTVLPLKAAGAESAFKCGTMACDEIEVDPTNKASLQSGAKHYMNNCMSCHSLKYARYQRTAEDIGVPVDIFEENLKFDNQAKIGELMFNSAPEALAKKWFGAAPPDLTMVARTRSPEWLYTYLRNFYADPSRPWGVNNKVFKDVGMPHVLLELQGMQECAPGPALAANGGVKRDPLTGEEVLFDEHTGEALNPCGRLKLVSEGSMTPEEFDTAMYDLVNFLAYTAEPMVEDRKRIGIFVLVFIALFFIFTYMLNREYWKDIH